MNLLYYCDEYPPARNGGIGTVVKLVAEAMANRGHRVIVAGKYWENQGRKSKTIEQINGVTVVRWHKGSYQTLGVMACSLIRNGETRKKVKAQRVFNHTHRLLVNLIKEYHIDLVEMPDYVDDFEHNEFLEVVKCVFPVPLLIRVHGSVSFLYFHLNGKEMKTKVRQDREHLNRADAVCAVSEFSGRYVKDHLSPEREVDVIYNMIDDNMFENTKNVEFGNQTILYFGKIIEMKGVFSLIKAFNMVAEKYPMARLKLVGSGETDKAQQLVDSRFSDRVEFVGFMPHAEIIDEIDKASFCVIPSYFETFSMAAVEVQARRRALVFTERTSGKELVEDGVDGLLVDPDNVSQIADKMELLLSNVELRDKLAKRGFESCRKRFSSEIITPQMETYYKKIITNYS